MNIGEAASFSGASARRIRYYEQIGLIDPAKRTASGYRVYDDRVLHTLNSIRRSPQLGSSLEEIARLFDLWRDQHPSSADVQSVARWHIDDMRSKIAELQAMVDTLQRVIDCCDGDDRPDCPILDELQGIAS